MRPRVTRYFNTILSVAILSSLTSLAHSASGQELNGAEFDVQQGQQQDQKHTQTRTEQSWTAHDIKEMEQAQRDGEPMDSHLQAGLDEFNKYFSTPFLRGYTQDPEDSYGDDASMETYYLDEDNQIVALYDDFESPSEFLAGSLNPYPLTQWERDISGQAVSHPSWVMGLVSQTSSQLKQQIETARAQGKPYLIWVNAASFTLRVIDVASETEVLRSRVIVGAPGTQTPLFNTDVVNIKFNPDWSPPPSLKRKGKRYSPPSDHNPLGQARFSTNNSQNIYLHDTNNHALFDEKIRALSAGCVRVQEWHALAQILGGLQPEEVDGHTAGNRTHFYDVPDALVWISYQRLDLNESGEMVLYGDIYRKQPLPENTLPRDV